METFELLWTNNSRPFAIDNFVPFSDKIWGEGMAPYILAYDGPAQAAPPSLAHTPP